MAPVVITSAKYRVAAIAPNIHTGAAVPASQHTSTVQRAHMPTRVFDMNVATSTSGADVSVVVLDFDWAVGLAQCSDWDSAREMALVTTTKPLVASSAIHPSTTEQLAGSDWKHFHSGTEGFLFGPVAIMLQPRPRASSAPRRSSSSRESLVHSESKDGFFRGIASTFRTIDSVSKLVRPAHAEYVCRGRRLVMPL